MDRRKFNQSILASIQLAEKLGLEPRTIQPSSLPSNSRLRSLVDDGATYLAYYQETVDLRHLNFFVGDGDILQFSFFEQGRSFSLRYAFFGSPYRPVEEPIGLIAVDAEGGEPTSKVEDFNDVVSDFEDAVSSMEAEERDVVAEGLQEAEDDALSGEQDQAEIDGAGLSLRYEYAENEYRRLVHPCAHLHIGWQRQGRVPVRRVWTPELFAGFVFRNVFADLWFRSQDANVPEMDGYESEIFFKREKMNTKRVHETMFHAFEAEVVFLD